MDKQLYIRFDTIQEKIDLYQEGKKSYFYMYLVNPSIKWNDIYFVISMLILLLTLRLCLFGTNHRKKKFFSALLPPLLSPYCKPKKEKKFSENLWYVCWHTFSFAFGVYILYSQALTYEKPGWPRLLLRHLDVKWYWFPTPAERELGIYAWPFFTTTKLFKVFYLTELAFWTSCGIYLFLETLRDDFYALLLHHILTCLLIMLSYVLNFWRIGTIILATHDFADILLYTTKTCYYSKIFPVIIDIAFGVFTLGFLVSRLIFFPVFCLRPVLDLNRFREWSNGAIRSHWQVPGGLILPCALCILQMLHIFWFVLIMKMCLKTLRGEKVSEKGDIRSDSEYDEIEDKDDLNSEKYEESLSSEQDIDEDQRMKISSLPGVRPTLSRSEIHRKNLKKKHE